MTLSSLLSAAALAVPLFVATNTDDIFVLVGFLADTRFTFRAVIIGQYLGMGALTLVSVVAAHLALTISGRYVALLGLVPIALGLKKLIDLRRDIASGDADGRPTLPGAIAGRILAVATMTMANGGDNVGAYAPLFATRSGAEVAAIAGTFAVMTAAWCWLAHCLVWHRVLGATIRRYGHRVLPFVLIALGLFILR